MKEQRNKVTNFVLEEDEHLANISQIITRDFYPELGKLNKESVDAAPTLTLNNYLVNFKSDENEIFSNLIENNNKEWRQRFWWLDKEHREKHKQNILMPSQTQSHKMITNQKNKLLAIEAAGNSNFFFPNNSEIIDKDMEKYDKEKKIVYQNTRLAQMVEPLEYAIKKKNQQYALDTKLIPTPLLHGIYDQDIKKNEKYGLDDDGFKMPSKRRIVETVNGYKLLTIPSPSPNTMQSPLMTYGQIEDTPQRLPEYKIPNTPKRDIVLQQLNQKMIQKKKEEKQRKQSTVMRILGSSTPGSIHSLSKSKIGSSVRKQDSTVRKKEQSLQGLLKL